MKQNVTIAGNTVGQPWPIVTWSKSVGSLPEYRTEVRNGTLKIYSLVRKDGGIYICKAENILGSATDTAHLMVFSPLKFKARPLQEITPVIGSSVRFHCQAESDLVTTVTWTMDGKSSLVVEATGLQKGTRIVNNSKKSHQRSYTCKATNGLTALEAKVKMNSPVIATSCFVIRKYVSRVGRNYVIDPDGVGSEDWHLAQYTAT